MRSGRCRIASRFREKVRQNVVRRSAPYGVGGDQHRYAAKPMRTHPYAGEGRNDGNVVERRRSPDDILKYELPGKSSGWLLIGPGEHPSEIHLDIGLAIANTGHSLREIVARGAWGARRFVEGGPQVFDGNREGFGWTDFRGKIEAITVRFGLRPPQAAHRACAMVPAPIRCRRATVRPLWPCRAS